MTLAQVPHGGGRGRRRRRPASILAVSFLAASAALVSRSAAEDPAAPTLSPGQIAPLVRLGPKPEVIDTLRRAVRDGAPEVRAAGARVASALRAGGLLENLREALKAETNREAAREQATAIAALGGRQDDSMLLDAARRLGAPMPATVALLIARARGPDSIPEWIPLMTEFGLADEARTGFLRAATRGEESTLRSAADQALRAGDPETWLSAMSAAEEEGVQIENPALVLALRHPDAKLSAETAWRLASAFSQSPPKDKAVFLADYSTGNPDTSDIDLWFGRELLSRVLGRPPVESEGWIAHVRSAPWSRMDSLASRLSSYLTDSEHKALKKRFKKHYVGRRLSALARSTAESKPETAPAAKRAPAVRLATGFPPRLVNETLAASRCGFRGKVLLGLADVTFDPLGRPSRVLWRRAPFDPACTEAMATLFSLSMAPPDRLTHESSPEMLFLILEDGYNSRLEGNDSATDSERLPLEVEHPERTHFVKPDYPASLREARLGGKAMVELVVNRQGLVSDIRLLNGADDEVVVSAFRAIAQWRYKPASSASRPFKVYLTAIVEFTIR